MATLGNQDIEIELRTYGLEIAEKIILKESDTYEEHVRYLKVTNSLGESFYILLDSEAIICCNGRCERTMNSTDSKILPDTLRVSTIDRMNLIVSGQVFECDGSICTLQRKTEETQSFQENVVGNALTDKLNPISYPLIRLSDIRGNPGIVINAASENYRETRNIIYNRLLNDLSETQVSISSYTKLTDAFFKNFNGTSSSFRDAVSLLEKRIKTYIEKGNLSTDEMEQLNLYYYNLKVRNQMLETFIGMGERFNQINSEITMKLSELERLNNSFEQFSQMMFLIIPK